MFNVLLSALQSAFTWLLPKIAVFFGIYAISNTVAKPIFDYLKAQALAQLGAAASQYSQFFQILGVYDFLNILFAAYIMSLSIKAAKSASSTTT